ncbi:TPA: hypothetical protein ACF82Z_002926 [Staphylococcus aureus]|uniref:hypothetical protein n=2 Tax=Staphylococcus aureus TaxID=1280 RepID=UPI000923B06F|nr:hypothetical protein [Staphylococcus aureus]MCD2456213.1 hypothetical protein [Staphylococcus aureus]MCD2473467.1 hypothetical protein [Staphylococcus aureus]MCD2485649.1 hypothetical protein [Staphylococcus aureus]MCD2495769.1 hypothetical protein [Staphylococcus aureus]MCD2505310.1 hypothetical protein [Staphylococcus aureus]
MTKKGRKPILTETEAKEIVNSYVLKHGVSKEIQYIDLHKYCIELYQNQEIPKLPSESFWRKKDRAGRKLIDEVNSAVSHELERHEKNYELQNLLNLIDNKITNKELKTTLFNELKSKQRKIEQLEKELNVKEESILSLKKSREDLQQLNKQQQDLISQVFHYFLKKSSQENLVFFDSALNNIFSKPLDYLTLLRKEKTQNQNNVADFFKNRLNNN